MLDLINRTCCRVHVQVLLDASAEERLLLVAKASFKIGTDELTPTEAEIELADRYRGDPSSSSLVAASEIVLHKPRPDLLLSGNAYPARPGDTTTDVLYRVGSWSKHASVSGDRTWTRDLLGLRATAPAPFESIPLVYERAFGGVDLSTTPPTECPENPVGVGLAERREGAPLPNLEHPGQRLHAADDRPEPRGFGPVPPHWQPRRGLHGTFDVTWERTRMPLPPLDADPRAAQVAPPDQVYPGALSGGEEVELRGVRPGGASLRFRLPSMRVHMTVHDGERRLPLPAVLDTLHVDAEALRVDLTWRASTSVHERQDRLLWALVEATGEPHA